MAIPGKELSENQRVPGLGSRIREAVDRWALERGHRGVLAFSKAAGISNTVLSEYIRDETEPGAYNLLRISQVSGVSIDHLLKGDAPQPIPTVKEWTGHLLRALRGLPQVTELHREQRRRYLDLLDFIGSQIRRLTIEAQKILDQLHADALGKTFDVEDFRRRFAKGDDEEEGDA